ncbi:MAG: PEP-CTERM sorting domain-containing protein [Pelomonas sp.]|nr:PEP-CTERM sorting domain-containing protein [Roseateles sp.]
MPSTKFRLSAALLALSAWAAPALAATPQVTFVATPNPAQQGSTLDIGVLIAGVADLYAYNFSLTFDASLLQVTSIDTGSFLATGGTTTGDTGTVDNTAGTISFAYNSLIGAIPGVSGNGTLLTVHLSAIGTGTSPLTFVAADTTFLDSNLATITVQTVDSSVQVAAAVPEPESYLMLAAGLAGLGLWRRRQKAA